MLGLQGHELGEQGVVLRVGERRARRAGSRPSGRPPPAPPGAPTGRGHRRSASRPQVTGDHRHAAPAERRRPVALHLRRPTRGCAALRSPFRRKRSATDGAGARGYSADSSILAAARIRAPTSRAHAGTRRRVRTPGSATSAPRRRRSRTRSGSTTPSPDARGPPRSGADRRAREPRRGRPLPRRPTRRPAPRRPPAR